MILGLTGTLAAGKDTVAEYLTSKGFVRTSLSDAVRDECRRRGLPLDRTTLVRVANELRAEYGAAVLAERIAVGIRGSGVPDATIVSVRNPEEVVDLQRLPHFHLVSVDAPRKIRYERLRARGRDGDGQLTYDEFVAQEKLELQHPDPNHQQLTKVMQLAEATIVNDDTFEALQARVDDLLERFAKR